VRRPPARSRKRIRSMQRERGDRDREQLRSRGKALKRL
jgi:hypothetical protein